MKYKNQGLLDHLQDSYYATLNTKKKACLRLQIADCKGDSSKLYKLVTNLTSKQEEEQQPNHRDTESLANDFAQYFQDKILKIRELFKGIEPYQPKDTGAPLLQKFAPMTVAEVTLIIKSMKSKSCELDIIPTHILKQMLPSIADLICKLVNLSLGEGLFSRDWKMAIVRLFSRNRA